MVREAHGRTRAKRAHARSALTDRHTTIHNDHLLLFLRAVTYNHDVLVKWAAAMRVLACFTLRSCASQPAQCQWLAASRSGRRWRPDGGAHRRAPQVTTQLAREARSREARRAKRGRREICLGPNVYVCSPVCSACRCSCICAAVDAISKRFARLRT